MRLHWPTNIQIKKSEWKRANEWVNVFKKKIQRIVHFLALFFHKHQVSIRLSFINTQFSFLFWVIEQHVRFNAAKRFVQTAKRNEEGKKKHTTRKEFSHTKNCKTSSRLQFAKLQNFTLLFHIRIFIRYVWHVRHIMWMGK